LTQVVPGWARKVVHLLKWFFYSVLDGTLLRWFLSKDTGAESSVIGRSMVELWSNYGRSMVDVWSIYARYTLDV